MPSAAPRNGPAQGVATKAASAPVPKLPPGIMLAGQHRQLERPQQVERDRRRQQQQDDGRARILQLERPAGRAPAGADRQQQRAQALRFRPPRRRHRPARRAAPAARRRPILARCNAFSARIGKTQGIRLSSMPPDQRAEDGVEAPHCAPKSPTRLAAARALRPARALISSPRPSPSASTPDSRRRLAAAALELGDQQVAIAAEALRRGIVDRPVVGREEIGLADVHALPAAEWRSRSCRLSSANFAGLASGRGSARRHSSNRARSVAGPLPTGKSSEILALLGHADLVGAGQPLRVGRGSAARPWRPPAP